MLVSPGPRKRSRPRHRERWLLPLGVTVLLLPVTLGMLNILQLLGMTIAVYLLVLFTRRPAMALRLLVVILPFQLVLTSALYALGAAGPLVRMAGLWKEAAALAIVLAGWGVARRQAHRLDHVDLWALAYVVLGSVYLILPELAVGSFGSSISIDQRFLAWRALVLPVLLLVGARHLRLAHHQLERLFHAVAVVGIVLGALAVLEFVASPLWNRFMVDTLRVNDFRVEVLEVDPTELGGAIDDVRTYGLVAGRSIVRVGGPMASYLQLSFVLLIALAVLLERIIQGRRARFATVGTALAGAGLLFTQTRSSIIGGCLLVLATLRPGPGRERASRVRFTSLVGLGALLVIPLVFSAGLADRFTAGDVESDDVHEVRFDAAVDSITAHPLGTGLATGASGSEGVADAIVPENQLLDVGVQLGVVGMVLILGLGLVLIRDLRAAAAEARGAGGAWHALAARSAMIGLLVPCWYLQPLATPDVGWVLFALAGAALGSLDRGRQEALGRVAGRLASGRR